MKTCIKLVAMMLMLTAILMFISLVAGCSSVKLAKKSTRYKASFVGPTVYLVISHMPTSVEVLSSSSPAGPFLPVDELAGTNVDALSETQSMQFYEVKVTSASAAFAWSPSGDTNILGYNLYAGGQSGVYTNKFTFGTNLVETITITNPPPILYVAATAYTSTEESMFSNETTYQLQNPQLTLHSQFNQSYGTKSTSTYKKMGDSH